MPVYPLTPQQRNAWNKAAAYLGTGTDGKPNLLHLSVVAPQWVVPNESAVLSPLDMSANPPWVPANCTVTTGHADPSGGANAAAVLETVAINVHAPVQTFAAGQIAAGPFQYTRFYCKGITRGFVGCSASGYGVWDLATGAVTDYSGCDLVKPGVDAGGGWWRFEQQAPQVMTPGVSSISIRPHINGTIAGRNYAGVLGQDAIHIYKPEIKQTSIVTLLNLGGAVVLLHYGDRFDLTNPNKASQKVYGPVAWNGQPGAICSAANWGAMDAVAAQFAGDDIPFLWAMAYWLTATTASQYLLCLGNSTVAANYHIQIGYGAGNSLTQRSTAATGVKNLAYGASDLNRHSYVNAFRGATGSLILDGVLVVDNGAQDTTALTVDRFTSGALRRATTSGYASMVDRVLLVARGSHSNAAATGIARLVAALATRL